MNMTTVYVVDLLNMTLEMTQPAHLNMYLSTNYRVDQMIQKFTKVWQDTEQNTIKHI